MFKQLTALCIFLAFVNQTFSAPFIMLDYYANTAAYAKNCVNKAKPKMHCNGKCQMMKKMAEEEKKEKENSDRKADYKAPLLSSKSFFYNITEHVVIYNIITTHFVSSALQHRSFDFFHPPQA